MVAVVVVVVVVVRWLGGGNYSTGNEETSSVEKNWRTGESMIQRQKRKTYCSILDPPKTLP